MNHLDFIIFANVQSHSENFSCLFHQIHLVFQIWTFYKDQKIIIKDPKIMPELIVTIYA